MNFLEALEGAFQPGAEEQAQMDSLPPMTVQQAAAASRESQAVPGIEALGAPKQGMEAMPFGPGGMQRGMFTAAQQQLARQAGSRAAANIPTPGTAVGPRTGPVQGGDVVPYSGRVGPAGGGQTYEGSLVDDVMRALVPGKGGAPGPGPGGGVAPRNARVQGNGAPTPDVMPMGGPTVPGPGAGASQAAQGGAGGGGIRPDSGGLSGFLRDAWGNAGIGQKVGALGALGGAGSTLWDMLGGSEEAEAEESAAPQASLLELMNAMNGGGRGAYQVAAAPELPKVQADEFKSLVPEVDYDSLPRPDFASIRERLASLAPDAPEERSFLDQVPTYAKNMIGFGLLLGPVGMLLGAATGMAENRFKDRKAADRFKEESREHLKEMLGFDLDWAKAERAMALEEGQGARDQAIAQLEGQRSLEKWAMEDMDWQLSQQLRRTQMLNAGRTGSASGGFDKDDFENLQLRLMLSNPGGYASAINALAGAEEGPVTSLDRAKLPDGLQDSYDMAQQMQLVQSMISGLAPQ